LYSNSVFYQEREKQDPADAMQSRTIKAPISIEIGAFDLYH
jgi:hypothetical protein